MWLVAETGPTPSSVGPPHNPRYGEHINAVVMVGAEVWRGKPSALDRLARLALLPHMNSAVVQRVRLVEQLADQPTGRWILDARPLFAPGKDEHVVGVLGCYHHPDKPPGDAPRVGTWTWELTEGGPDHTNRLCWDDTLFHLHGLEAPSGERAEAAYPIGRRWHGPHFLQNLVLDGWQPIVREFRDNLPVNGARELVVCSYRTVDQVTGRPLPLRMIGRASPTPGRFHGLTFIDPQAQDIPPEGARHDTDPGAVDRHQAANYTLNPQPIIMIDTWLEEIASMSPKVRTLGLKLPEDRHLRKLVFPLEWLEMRELLDEACRQPNTLRGPRRFRLATDTSAAWRYVAVTAVGVPAADSVEPRRVLLGVTPEKE